MCIWNCKVEDRHCEYCTYLGGCVVRPVEPEGPTLEERVRSYVEIMNGLTGVDVLQRSKRMLYVWGRNMIAYQLREDGYNYSEIGRQIGLDHATVLYCCRRVTEMLHNPIWYQLENKIWRDFQERIITLHKTD